MPSSTLPTRPRAAGARTRTTAGSLAGLLVLAGFGPPAPRSRATVAAPAPVCGAGPAAADALLRRAAEALGGEDALRAIRTVDLAGVASRAMREQSERPEGPWLPSYAQFTERRDYAAGVRVRRAANRGFESPNWWSDTTWHAAPTLVVRDSVAARVVGGRAVPGGSDAAAESAELLALSPERVLLTARAAPDRRACADTVAHGVAHAVVRFTWRGAPVSLLLNRATAMPAAVRITRARPASFFWAPWGDVSTTYAFSAWTLEPGGVRYPRLLTVESGAGSDVGPDYVWHVDHLAFDRPDPGAVPAVPDSVWAGAAHALRDLNALPIGPAAARARALAPGVVQLPGPWNVVEVAQPGGVVVVEGPMSAGYSAQVIADAARRFPGARVQAVVTTSDAWPHIGGMREYVARGVPVYALDLNVPILRRLWAVPHRAAPDSLARAPRAPVLRVVRGRTLVGTGANRLELIPFRTAAGERQMMVYVPDRRLLYASDLFSRDGAGGWFTPQYLSEAVAAVARERLAVDTVFGMHLEPTAWSAVQSAARAAVRAPAGAAR